MKTSALVLAAVVIAAPILRAQESDWSVVETILGRKGVTQGDMLKVGFPRTDLHVRIGDTPVEPAFGLGSWIGFAKMDSGGAMAMGDLVLLEKEVPAVERGLLAEGIGITALHNHLLGETPQVVYLHFGATGQPAMLASKLRHVLELTGTPMKASPAPSPATTDWSAVEKIFNKKGAHNGDILSLAFPRTEAIVDHGMAVKPFLGVATGINFERVGPKAAATGDFVLTAGEVQPVFDALTKGGIEVTAIHSHMLTESPRIFFLHFWGLQDPEDLARHLNEALSRTSVMR